MPPKKTRKKEYLIILVSIGCTDKTDDGNESSFLEKSKLVMKHVIQRKIFLRPNDEIGIILMGTNRTNNHSSCNNIVELNALEKPSWDMVEEVMNLKASNKKNNWVDGIRVMLDYVNRECIESGARRTVILLTDFKEEPNVINQCDPNEMADNINTGDINLLVIGNKPLNRDSQIEFNASEEIFVSLCDMVGAEIMTFEETIPKLTFYKHQPNTPMAWRVNMDVFDIAIPVTVYLKTTKDSLSLKWSAFTEAYNATIPIERNRVLVDKCKQEIDPDEIITGNMYGRKFIPFSDADKDALKYKSGPKSFIIYGFTKQERIKMDSLAGKGSYIVVPQQPQYASPFYALVKAMSDSKKVAIVRRVYQSNFAPKMGVLIPEINVPGQPWCLVYIELTFAEDRRIVQVKPTKSALMELSDDQQEAIDNLIESMMLMDVEDETTKEKKEAFQIGTVCDISRQRVWDLLAHRALNPTKSELPEVSETLTNMFSVPSSVQVKSEPALRAIKKLFPIKRLEPKKSSHSLGATGSGNDLLKFKHLESVVKQTTQNVLPHIDEKRAQQLKDSEEMVQSTESLQADLQKMDVDFEEMANDI